MEHTSYCIASRDTGGGVALWLGGVDDGSGNYWCDVEAGVPHPGTMEFWTLVPLPATDAYYLLNQTANLFACFASDDKRVALRPLDVHDPSFVVKLDDVGDGWVAINNGAKDRVFDVEGGHPAPGTPVIQHPWGDGTNQMWKFVDSNIVIGEGVSAKG